MIQTASKVPGEAVRTVRTVAPGEQKPVQPAVDPVDVEQNLMRFSGEFATRMTLGIDQLRRDGHALSHIEALQWKLAFNSTAYAIASGPNAIASLLDMTVYVTEARMSIEDYWQPRVFGDSARPLLESCRESEKEIWKLANRVLKPEQKTDLQEAIKKWHQNNTSPQDLLVARAVGLALEVSKASADDKTMLPKSGSILGLLMIDPLAELDPTRREIAQTRLFAERTLFVAQKMPTLLRWQAELLSAEALEQPGLQQLSTNVTQIAASVDRFSRTIEQLPQQIGNERSEILKALQTQESALLPVLADMRQTIAETRATLNAGTQTSDSLNTTLGTFNNTLKQLGVGEPPATNAVAASDASEPFRIQDYDHAVAQLEVTARQLTVLLQTFDHTFGPDSRAQLAAQLAPVVQDAQTRSEALIDYIFWKSVLFVGIVLAAALLYRLVSVLLSRMRRGDTPADAKRP